MHEEYIREQDIKEITNDERNRELIKNVIKTRIELNMANRSFQSAEPELVDYYTYLIKATQAKLDYLLRKVKSEGLELDMINEMELRNEQAV